MSGGIACVIPVYNAERYLGEAIDSALAQTLPPEQVIVVDDGSTDGSGEVAKSFGGRVRYVRQENLGVSVARNRGIELSDRPFIALLDADDRFHPEKLARQMQRFAARPELDLSVTAGQNFWSPDLPEDERYDFDLEPRLTPGNGSCWMARRRFFDTFGLFDTDMRFKFTQSSELYLRAQDRGAVIEPLDEVLVYRRLHASNHTTDRRGHLDSILTLMKKHADQRRQAT